MVAEIPLGNQPFDLAFHPTNPLIFVALLTGQVKAFSYSKHKSGEEFEHSEVFSVRPTKRSCRGLATSVSGDRVYSVTKDKTLHEIDTATGVVLESVPGAHESAINRISLTMPNMLATGDDQGVIKLWDPRKKPNREIRAYTQHYDYISDFLWLEDKKHLVASSADGTLSVMDVRANKTEPIAQSEDQEDELLSIVAIRGGTKTVIGTQSGVLSIFNNQTKGWGDCVDRIKGHPNSVDALYALPSSLLPPSLSSLSDSHGQAILATGSSDGLVRLVQLFPTKILGVAADHGEFPVERLKMDVPAYASDLGVVGGNGSRWLGSISHGETVLMTDLGDALEESDDDNEEEEEKEEFVFGNSNNSELGSPAASTREETATKTNPLDDFCFSKTTTVTPPMISSSAITEKLESEPTSTQVAGGAASSALPRVRTKADVDSDLDRDTNLIDRNRKPSAISNTSESCFKVTPVQKNEDGEEGGAEGRKKKKRKKGRGAGPAVDPMFFDGL